MKVAFMGASGTGKTTLAKHVSERFDLDMNPWGSRQVAAALGFDRPYDVDEASEHAYVQTFENNEWASAEAGRKASALCALSAYQEGEESCRSMFQARLMKEKRAWENCRAFFVTDRSTVDQFCYSALHNSLGTSTKYLASAKKGWAKYDLVFYTPLHVFQNTDGDPNRISSEVSAYHQIFELLLEGTSKRWTPGGADAWCHKVMTLTMPGLEDRIQAVNDVLLARMGGSKEERGKISRRLHALIESVAGIRVYEEAVKRLPLDEQRQLIQYLLAWRDVPHQKLKRSREDIAAHVRQWVRG